MHGWDEEVTRALTVLSMLSANLRAVQRGFEQSDSDNAGSFNRVSLSFDEL